VVKIYTLGTSNRSVGEFLEILIHHKIQVVVDVRRFPSSKLFPHFQKENLKKFLAENKIKYYHLKALGGFRKGGYEKYVKTKIFAKNAEKLKEIGKNFSLCLICAERLPWKCHRAILGRELEKRGVEVFHIVEKEKIWQPNKEPREIKPTCEKKWKSKI